MGAFNQNDFYLLLWKFHDTKLSKLNARYRARVTKQKQVRMPSTLRTNPGTPFNLVYMTRTNRILSARA